MTGGMRSRIRSFLRARLFFDCHSLKHAFDKSAVGGISTRSPSMAYVRCGWLLVEAALLAGKRQLKPLCCVQVQIFLDGARKVAGGAGVFRAVVQHPGLAFFFDENLNA